MPVEYKDYKFTYTYTNVTGECRLSISTGFKTDLTNKDHSGN